MLAGAVVVIYDEHTVYHPVGLKEDLATTLRERGVHLEQELARTYDPVTWEIITCGGRLAEEKTSGSGGPFASPVSRNNRLLQFRLVSVPLLLPEAPYLLHRESSDIERNLRLRRFNFAAAN